MLALGTHMVKDRTRETQTCTSIRQRSLIIIKEAVLGMDTAMSELKTVQIFNL